MLGPGGGEGGGPRAHAKRVYEIAPHTHARNRAPVLYVRYTRGHTGKAHTYLTRCKFRNWKVPLLHSPIQDTEPESSSRKFGRRSEGIPFYRARGSS